MNILTPVVAVSPLCQRLIDELARMAARPASIRGVDVPEPSNFLASADKHIADAKRLLQR